MDDYEILEFMEEKHTAKIKMDFGNTRRYIKKLGRK